MTEQEFFELCKAHDLTYAYSDDHRVWRAGETSMQRIREAAQQLPRAVAVRVWNETVDLKIVGDARQQFYWK